MNDQPVKKPVAAADYVKREVTAMSRILLAIRQLPPKRRRPVMDYINGLMNDESLDRLGEIPERPGQDK